MDVLQSTDWENKRNPEMEENAIQTEPAQTTKLSISGSHLIPPPGTTVFLPKGTSKNFKPVTAPL